MSMIWYGIVKCPKCSKYLRTVVSRFVDFETPEDEKREKERDNRIVCPYCKSILGMEDWYPNFVFNPTLKKNKMTEEQVLKIQKEVEVAACPGSASIKPIIKSEKSLFTKLRDYVSKILHGK